MKRGPWFFLALCAVLIVGSTIAGATGGSVPFAVSNSDCHPQGFPQGVVLPICSIAMSGTIRLDGCSASACIVTLEVTATSSSPLPGDLDVNSQLTVSHAQPGPPISSTDVCGARSTFAVSQTVPGVPWTTASCSGTVTISTPYPDQPIPNQCVNLNPSAGGTLKELPSQLGFNGQPPYALDATATLRPTFFLVQEPQGSGIVVLRANC